MKNNEHKEQVAVIHWASIQSIVYPSLSLLYAIPNGGHRAMKTARFLRAEGVKAGVPDLCLPVPANDHHGLYIELKARDRNPKRSGKGGVSEEQREWIENLRAQGYRVEVCYGADEAIDTIKHHVGIGL